MCKLRIYGKIYECEKAIKGNDFLHLLNGSHEELSIFNITNFDGIELLEGQWSSPNLTEVEILKQELVTVQEALDFLIMNGGI